MIPTKKWKWWQIIAAAPYHFVIYRLRKVLGCPWCEVVWALKIKSTLIHCEWRRMLILILVTWQTSLSLCSWLFAAYMTDQLNRDLRWRLVTTSWTHSILTLCRYSSRESLTRYKISGTNDNTWLKIWQINSIVIWGEETTVCPGSSDPFYVVTYYIELVTTSWTYSSR